MREARIERFAQVLTQYSLELRAGDLAMISGPLAAAPLLRAVHREALRLGAIPVVDVRLPDVDEALMIDGSDEQIATITPLERIGPEQANAFLRVSAPENTRARRAIPAERERVYRRSRAELHARFLRRAAEGSLRWSLTLFPTQALAQEAEMSLREYEAFVAAACWLDDDDPVARWRELAAYQDRLIQRLAPAREIHVQGPDTDLRLSVAGRAWINSDGHRNFPSGEIFTGPVEDSAEGRIRFSYPLLIDGRRIEDIQLWFERGRVVRASAARNGDFLATMLDTDDGARFIGEFAFGTNPRIDRFTGNTLFDEKIGGTIHLALGSGYPDTGSKNRSAIHWDLVCDLRQSGTVLVDGEVFLRNGAYAESADLWPPGTLSP